MATLLLLVLIILLIGAVPAWPYNSGWGYYPPPPLGRRGTDRGDRAAAGAVWRHPRGICKAPSKAGKRVLGFCRRHMIRVATSPCCERPYSLGGSSRRGFLRTSRHSAYSPQRATAGCSYPED